MANRHSAQKHAKGGGVSPKRDGDKEEYNAKGSKVMKEAREMKRGGKAHGDKGKARFDKKARGGSVAAKKIGDGKDMTSSPWSAAHTGAGKGPASNPSVFKGKK